MIVGDAPSIAKGKEKGEGHLRLAIHKFNFSFPLHTNKATHFSLIVREKDAERKSLEKRTLEQPYIEHVCLIFQETIFKKENWAPFLPFSSGKSICH